MGTGAWGSAPRAVTPPGDPQLLQPRFLLCWDAVVLGWCYRTAPLSGSSPLPLPPRPRRFSCPVATSAAARAAASGCTLVPCAARTSRSASASSTAARQGGGRPGCPAPSPSPLPRAMGLSYSVSQLQTLAEHDQCCPPRARPRAGCRLHPGVSASSTFPDGSSASASGSLFICVPSCLPAHRPLAREHWVMELGALWPPPLWLIYICLQKCPSLSRDTVRAISEATVTLQPSRCGRGTAVPLCRALLPGGG